MIKRLEELSFDVVRLQIDRRGLLHTIRAGSGRSAWIERLQARLLERSVALVKTVEHATGVYFPNRTHSARIATKKMRYAVEVAQETGVWRPPNALKDLKRIQATLGELHDVQVLIDHAEGLVAGSACRSALSLPDAGIRSRPAAPILAT